MAGRPTKQTVDYFPHYTDRGRTMFILESMYGNDGYAFWFKLLEILCASDGQVFDCSRPANWKYLVAMCRVTDDTAEAIIGQLVALGKIDERLWNEERKIWVQSLIDNLQPYYARSSRKAPKIEEESDEEEIRLDEIKQDGTAVELSVPEFNDGEIQRTLNLTCGKSRNRIEVNKKEINKEKETINSLSKESPARASISPDLMAELWNEKCGSAGLPRVAKMNDSRRAKAKVRIAEFGRDMDSQLATLNAVIAGITGSQFLRGGNGHGWTATFDWLLANATNWRKVIEGNYADTRGGASVRAGGVTVRLGPGEWMEGDRRTYGDGRYTVPADAAPRPSERHFWSAESHQWTQI